MDDESDEKSPYGLEFFAFQTGLGFLAMIAAPSFDPSNYLTVMAAITFGLGLWFWIVEHREWHGRRRQGDREVSAKSDAEA